MPRLINADAYLDKVCTYKTTGCGSCKFQTVCPADEPTVEAIPIEFIKAFKKEFRAVASVKAVIDWLLEKWEKKNANNN